MADLVAHEASLRLYVLIAGFGAVAVREALRPRRQPLPAARGRWPVNVGLTLLLSVVVALVFPLLSVGVALAVERQGFGLLNLATWPAAVEFALAFVALDLGRYAQHLLLHCAPLLWRLHRVHHSDFAYDCTTALLSPLSASFDDAGPRFRDGDVE